jgi:anti-anti-sigma regulatory factor
MEAVRKSQPMLATPPTGDAPAAPKLTIEKFADGPIACLKFNGTIDESFEGKKVARSIEAQTLVLDLGGVKKISSFGIREWVDFVSTAVKQVKTTSSTWSRTSRAAAACTRSTRRSAATTVTPSSACSSRSARTSRRSRR